MTLRVSDCFSISCSLAALANCASYTSRQMLNICCTVSSAVSTSRRYSSRCAFTCSRFRLSGNSSTASCTTARASRGRRLAVSRRANSSKLDACSALSERAVVM
uniref:Putative secreted protein n=1 Tax=Anopheles darlingi TaxID=43151 RepID=A0A2M4D085_ANODA